jgi:hypothetical protein
MPIQKELPEAHFDSVVRWVKHTDVDRLHSLENAVAGQLDRLGVRRRRRLAARAVAGIPAGSDHFDSGSLLEWACKVEAVDKAAVDQLLALHATIRSRLEG